MADKDTQQQLSTGLAFKAALYGFAVGIAYWFTVIPAQIFDKVQGKYKNVKNATYRLWNFGEAATLSWGVFTMITGFSAGLTAIVGLWPLTAAILLAGPAIYCSARAVQIARQNQENFNMKNLFEKLREPKIDNSDNEVEVSAVKKK